MNYQLSYYETIFSSISSLVLGNYRTYNSNDEIDIGKVAKDFIGLIWSDNSTQKTVTGAAVKLKTWLINKTKDFYSFKNEYLH